MSMISMNDLFYGERESVLILKDEDKDILETIHRYNYFYAEPPPIPEEGEPEEIEQSEQKTDGNEEKKMEQELVPAVVLKVPMCCVECEEAVAIVLRNVPGVEDVQTILLTQRVTVFGQAAPADLLHACRDLKIFRKTRFWSDDSN